MTQTREAPRPAEAAPSVLLKALTRDSRREQALLFSTKGTLT